MTKIHEPIHPGEILQEEFLTPLELTQHRLAVSIRVPPRRINEIVHGKRRITTDTAHLALGGMDPYQIISDYWPRVAEIHYKDALPAARTARSLVVPKTGPSAGGHGYFRNLGGKDSGGVDFPRIQQFLIDRNYSGWVTLDLDASMIEGKDMEETLKINIRYLTDVLGVNPAEL